MYLLEYFRLLEGISRKNNENDVDLELPCLDDVIFTVLAFRIRVLLHKVCLSRTQ